MSERDLADRGREWQTLFEEGVSFEMRDARRRRLGHGVPLKAKAEELVDELRRPFAARSRKTFRYTKRRFFHEKKEEEQIRRQEENLANIDGIVAANSDASLLSPPGLPSHYRRAFSTSQPWRCVSRRSCVSL